MGAESRRLYVGNLFPEVTDEDIKTRFSKFGSVTKVEIKSKRDIDGEVTETFAFIDLGSGDRGLADCIAGLNNTKWKGKVMKLQQAKESFMERLARERRERESGGGPGGGDVKAVPAPPVTKPATAAQERGLDGGRLAGGKLRKRDFTEEREDFKGFNIKKKSSTDNKYDPMGIFKAKLAGDDEVGKVEGSEDKGEGDGEVKDGMVIFGEEEGGEGDEELFNVEKMKVSKIYHSSSEEEQPETPVETKKVLKKKAAKEDKSSAEFKAKMTERFLKKQKLAEEEKAEKEAFKSGGKKTKKKDGAYYSDSDEESDDEAEKGHEVLEKLQSFAGDLWKDSDDEGETGKTSSALKGDVDEDESSEEDGDDVEDEEDSSDDDEEVDEDGYLVWKPTKVEEYVIPEQKKKSPKPPKYGDIRCVDRIGASIQHIKKADRTKCALCNNRDFGSNITLEKHINSAHSNAANRCGLCTMVFVSMDELKEHYTNQHGI